MNYFPRKISNNFINFWQRFQSDDSQSKRTVSILLKPETSFEKKIIGSKDFRNGLFWGEPRFGHPEGKIIFHIQEVFKNIDLISTNKEERAILRIIALVHDTFKYIEDKSIPRDWSKHHAIIARDFIRNYTDDQCILDIIESHDDVFHAWNIAHRGNPEKAKSKLDDLILHLGDNLDLYYKFFLADTQTGDKIQAPVYWFEKEANLNIIRF